MSSHAALTVSPRERASVANPSAPRAAIAPHKRIEPARRTRGNYAAACRASNANIGSNSVAPYSWTLAARGGEAPAPAGAAVVQERPDPQHAGEHLAGRVAVVTGGATGLGRAICLDFAQRGASVAFNYVELPGRDVSAQALLTETALKGCGVRVYSARCDVRNHDDVEQFMTQVKERLGGVHCLVNNAGVTHDGALWRLPPDAWREVMETNVTGAFNCIQAAAPTMRAQRYGKIVKTELLTKLPREVLERAERESILGRVAEPEDIAHVVLFLCSEAARHITGQTIIVDGGLTLA